MVYMEMHVSKSVVVEWHQKFHSQWQGMSDKAWSCQSLVVTTPENIAEVEEALHVDTYRHICAVLVQFDMSIGTVHTIMQCVVYHKMFIHCIR